MEEIFRFYNKIFGTSLFFLRGFFTKSFSCVFFLSKNFGMFLDVFGKILQYCTGSYIVQIVTKVFWNLQDFCKSVKILYTGCVCLGPMGEDHVCQYFNAIFQKCLTLVKHRSTILAVQCLNFSALIFFENA